MGRSRTIVCKWTSLLLLRTYRFSSCRCIVCVWVCGVCLEWWLTYFCHHPCPSVTGCLCLCLCLCLYVCSSYFTLHRHATHSTNIRPSKTWDILFIFQFALGVVHCTHTDLTVLIPVLDSCTSSICSCLEVCVWFVTSRFLHTLCCVHIVHTVICYSCTCSYCGHCDDCCLSVGTVTVVCFWLCNGISGLSLASYQKFIFDPRSVRVGFVVNKVVLGQVFLPLLQFFLVIIIATMLCTLSLVTNTIYVTIYILLAADSIVK